MLRNLSRVLVVICVAALAQAVSAASFCPMSKSSSPQQRFFGPMADYGYPRPYDYQQYYGYPQQQYPQFGYPQGQYPQAYPQIQPQTQPQYQAQPQQAPAQPSAQLRPIRRALVTIRNRQFDHPEILLYAGGSVTWVNKDKVPHTITSTQGMGSSGKLYLDQWARKVFPKPGRYEYVSEQVPFPRGVVIVVPDPEADAESEGEAEEQAPAQGGN